MVRTEYSRSGVKVNFVINQSLLSVCVIVHPITHNPSPLLYRKLVKYDDWCSIVIHVALDNTVITDEICKFIILTFELEKFINFIFS